MIFLGICEESRPKKFANRIRIGAPKRLTPTQEIRAKVQICLEFSQLTWAVQCVFNCLSTLSRNIYDPDCEKKLSLKMGELAKKVNGL